MFAPLNPANVNASALVVALLALHVVLVTNLLTIWCMSQGFQLGTWQVGGLVLSSTLSFLSFSGLPFSARSFVLSD